MCVSGPGNSDDQMLNYSLRTLELGLMNKALRYLFKQPDYYTFISLLKIIMPTLFAKSSASKYAREILRYLIHHVYVLSPKEAHKSFYRQFVNLGNDKYSHIPADLSMEYIVRQNKKMLKHKFSGQTAVNVNRRSSSLAAVIDISESFDSNTNTIVRAKRHKRVSSYFDEHDIIENLLSVKPYENKSLRKLSQANVVDSCNLKQLEMFFVTEWIEDRIDLFCSEIGK